MRVFDRIRNRHIDRPLKGPWELILWDDLIPIDPAAGCGVMVHPAGEATETTSILWRKNWRRMTSLIDGGNSYFKDVPACHNA